MDYLRKYNGEKGHIPVVKKGDCGLEYITFDLLVLDGSMEYSEKAEDSEVCLVVLGGKCTVEAEGNTWEEIGERPDVFGGKAASVYIPTGNTFKVSAVGGPVEVAVLRTLSDTKGDPVYIPPENVKEVKRGKDNWTRFVHDIVDKDVPAGHMLVGETHSPPGNWSSAPPHCHEKEDPPDQSKHEEIYFFKVKPEQGFQVIRLYTDDGAINETYTVEQNDTVIISRGYHPVAAGPGYRGYYLWLLAGKERKVVTHDDEKHCWLLDTL